MRLGNYDIGQAHHIDQLPARVSSMDYGCGERSEGEFKRTVTRDESIEIGQYDGTW